MDLDSVPLISVIIPTFNRDELLKTSLESLLHQSIPQTEYEVIVVDDGSTDATAEVYHSLSQRLPLKYIPVRKNSGISAAKNLGVFAARSPLLLFFDDDDVAAPNLLVEHLKTHAQHPEEHIAVLGYTTWSPSREIKPVMKYVTDIGQFLFSYGSIQDGQELDFTFFWGGRTSCKKSLLTKNGVFNQQFRSIIEDIELGYRLARFGLRVIFNQRAISYMVRPITFEAFRQRCERQGQARYLFSKLHPHPYVRAYCGVSKAEEKWRFAEKSFDRKVRRVHAIEALLQTKMKPADRELLTRELHELYGWTFMASTLKGIAAAKQAQASKDTGAAGVSPPQSDHEHLQKKWRRRPSLSSPKENILVIDPFLPVFDQASGSLRLLHILKALVRAGYQVTFVAVSDANGDRYRPILQDLGIEVHAGDPDIRVTEQSNAIKPILDLPSILSAKRYECIILSTWSVAEFYLPVIRKHSPQPRIIVDTIDIHFLREGRRAEVEGDTELAEKALEKKRRELDAYRRADRLWVVTPEDKHAIEALVSPVPIDIIPNIHAVPTNTKPFETTAGLLFVGNFRHEPNKDAVRYFCKEIFPLIQKALPEVVFNIVGGNPTEEIKALASKRIHVAGQVPDLSPYLAGARVSVSPLRYGAGMKGKVGEALAWGLPVVTTSIGAEGMDLVDGREALIADSPEQFAERVIQVYRDRELWTRLATNGKRIVAERWSPEAMQARLESAISNTIALSARSDSPLESRISDLKSQTLETPSCPDGSGQTCSSAELQTCHPKSSLVSIIILACNQLEDTRRCLESLLRNTTTPYELIMVDNGSQDGTPELLSALQHELRELQSQNDSGIGFFCRDFRFIRHEENLGFALGNNTGIAIAKGDYVLLLNNDTVVTPGWLERLVRCAEASPQIGIVGPMSNRVAGCQLVESVAYDLESLDGLDSFALDWATQHARTAMQTWRVMGMCMLIKREVLNKIGGLDSRYGLGNFEDDDFCLRATLAGYVAAIAQECFIHHAGSRTFSGQKIDYREALLRNWEIFKRKWGLPEDLPYGSPFDVTLLFNLPFEPERHFCAIHTEETSPQSLFDLLRGFQQQLALSNLHEMNRIATTAIAQHPGSPESWLLRAMTLRLNQRLDGAVSAIERSLQLRETPEALFELIQVCLEVNDSEKAHDTAQRLKTRFPAWVEDTCQASSCQTPERQDLAA